MYLFSWEWELNMLPSLTLLSDSRLTQNAQPGNNGFGSRRLLVPKRKLSIMVRVFPGSGFGQNGDNIGGIG